MCNLYTVRKSAAEVAARFGVANPARPMRPKKSIHMVREEAGARVMRSMASGSLLRLQGMKVESRPKPVNNIADMRKGMWVGFARKPQWGCLISVTASAEAEGPKAQRRGRG